MMSSTVCPICDAPVHLAAGTVIDELMECSDCGTDLVVTSLDPPAVDEAPATEEDWGQ
jgi:alpha-aminoadipate carrier protein LysW